MDFLKGFQEGRGFPPTNQEIRDHFNFASPQTVVDDLKALERKRAIKIYPKVSRGTEIFEAAGIPLLGQIAAGSPVLAVEQTEMMDFASLFGPEDHFCLRVKGDSMIEDQIADGDYVVVRKQEVCNNGEIVVALVDGQEATLKRFFREPKRIRLEPANSSMKPIFSNDVQIMGVVIGMLRKY